MERVVDRARRRSETVQADRTPAPSPTRTQRPVAPKPEVSERKATTGKAAASKADPSKPAPTKSAPTKPAPSKPVRLKVPEPKGIELASEDAAPERSGDREIVNSVLKAFDVLHAFSAQTPRMTLSEVADYAGLTRASARRFLLTFTQAGYMETDGKRFQLTPKLIELSRSVVSSANIWDVARPVMNALSESLGESCFGAVLDGSEVLYVVQTGGSQRFVNVGIRVGSRLPAYCTSIGRVLLSGQSDEALERILAGLKPIAHTPKTVTAKGRLREIVREVRRTGWSVVDEELEVGLRSVSAPIRSRSGEIVAALNVCGPSVRVSLDEVRERFLPELLAATDRINRLIRD